MVNNTSNKPAIFALILLLSIFLFLSTIAFAVPNSLTIQGKLTNTAGTSQQGTFNFTFRVYDAATAGNELWAVINQSVTTDVNGIYDAILTGLNLSFADQYYLGIAVQGENESVPRINLTSAPYSFRANTSEALNPNQSYIITNLSVTGNATIGTGGTTLSITTQSFNLTRSGNLSLAGNITLGDQIVFRLGEIIDNFVDGWLKITGALNITSSLYVTGNANITGDLTVNNLFNVTASSGNVATSGTISAGGAITSRGQELQQDVNAFKTANYSTEYSSTGFKRANVSEYLGGADVNASLLKVGNISGFIQLEKDAYKLANFTSNLNSINDSISLWNRSSTNTILRFNDDSIGVGTSTPGQKLHVVGSTNVSATVNAPVVNTTLATQNITITSAAGSVIIRLG